MSASGGESFQTRFYLVRTAPAALNRQSVTRDDPSARSMAVMRCSSCSTSLFSFFAINQSSSNHSGLQIGTECSESKNAIASGRGAIPTGWPIPLLHASGVNAVVGGCQ
jgi:hypothetical protein